MATVRDVMTLEVFSSWPEENAGDALEYILMFGIHALPVLESGVPLGVVSVSDLTGELEGVKVRDRMSTPAVAIVDTAPMAEAARLITETGLHHIVVTDSSGAAVGFLSAIDTVAALLRRTEGEDAESPAPGLEWSGLETPHGLGLQAAPDGPGVFVLYRLMRGQAPVVVWAGSTPNVQKTLDNFNEDPPPRLAEAYAADQIRFRAAASDDTGLRQLILSGLTRRDADPTRYQ